MTEPGQDIPQSYINDTIILLDFVALEQQKAVFSFYPFIRSYFIFDPRMSIKTISDRLIRILTIKYFHNRKNSFALLKKTDGNSLFESLAKRF